MADNIIRTIFESSGTDKVVGDAKKVQAALGALATGQAKTVTATHNLTSALDGQSKKTKNVADATSRAADAQKNWFGHITRTTIQSALVNKLFLELVDVSGQAIKQLDLMGNFPKTMASMGQSTSDAKNSLQALSTYVGQVGGNLGDATSMVTRFTGATKDVKSATALFVGLNNALIAGDSSMEEQRLAAIQFAQALERGKPDMREWMALTQNMSFQLAQVATEMGYVNASALGEALRSGEESMAAFSSKLAELSTGTGPIAQQAMARMSGLQFTFNVLKNTMVQGLAAILNAVGRSNIASFFTFLTQVVKVLVGWIVTLINWLGSLVNFISRLFGGDNVFGKITGDAQNVADSIGGGATAAGDLSDGLDDAGASAKKLNKSLASFDKMNVLPDKESASGGSGGSGDSGDVGGGGGFDPSQMDLLGDIFGKIGGDLEGVSKWAKIFAGILAGIAGIKFAESIINQIDKISKAFGKAMGWIKSFGTGIANIPTVIVGGFGKLKPALASLGTFLTNPLVLVVAAIAAVVGGIIWLYKTNEDFKKGWDSAWGGAGRSVKALADMFMGILNPAIDRLKEAWGGFVTALGPVADKIGELVNKFKEWLANIMPNVSWMELLGRVLGEIAAIIVTTLITAIAKLASGILGLVTGLIELGTAIINFVVENFSKAKTAIQEFISNGIDKAKEKFDEFKKWIEDNRQTLINLGIVLTTIVAPKIVRLGLDFASTAKKALISFGHMSAGAIKHAALATAAWTKNAAVMAAQLARRGILLGLQLAKEAALWAATGVKVLASHAFMIAGMIAKVLLYAATLAVQAVRMAASWAMSMGPVGLLIAAVLGGIALIVANWDTVSATASKIFNEVKDIVQGVIDWVKQNWPLILAILAGPIGLAVLAIVKHWDTIKDAFKKAIDYVKEKWGVAVAFFQGVWDGIANVFSVVKTWLGDRFREAWEAIKGAFNFYKDFFQGVWDGIANVFSVVKTWLGDRFREAWDGIKSVFSGVQGWFQENVIDKILSTFSGIKDKITGFFSGVWDGLGRGLKDALNSILRLPLRIPSVTVAGKTIGGQTLIPRLAKGGLVDQPTLALVGEAGTEAVVPLENNTEWIDKLATKINTANGRGGQPIQLVVQIGEDRIATKMINLINEKTQMSGRNMIHV